MCLKTNEYRINLFYHSELNKNDQIDKLKNKIGEH